MKKLLLKSMLLLCALIVGSGTMWADDYEKYSGAITEGDYVIVYDGCALKNTITSNRWDYSEVTISSNKISNPAASIIWHIAASGSYWTIYNENISKYAVSTGSKNQGAVSETLNDNAKWTVSGSSTYDFENLARKNAKSDSGNKWLRKNGTYGFACYASGTGGALSLYKKVVTHTLTYSATNGSISGEGTSSTAIASGASVAEGATVTLTATPASGYAFSNWSVEGTGASLSSTTTNPTTFTMGSANATVTANFVSSSTPSIGLNATSVAATTAEKDGTITVTYNNIASVDAEVMFYESDGTTAATYDWLDAEINATDNTKLDYAIGENTGEARIAYMKVHEKNENVYSALITISQAAIEVSAPTISPTAGAVVAGTTVTLTQAAADQIRYTTDGTVPTKTTGTVYSMPITITSATTVKAIAIKNDVASEVAEAAYTITVATPECNLASSASYLEGTDIILTSAGNTIYYNMTINGDTPDDPTSSSTQYTGPISLSSGNIRIKAIAYDAYNHYSGILTRTFKGVAPTTLPFNWAGGVKADLTAMTGVVGFGLGSGYGATHGAYRVQFDNDNDYIEVFTNGQPGKVTIGVKMIGGSSTSKIKIQESADGVEFADVEELTISGSQNDIVNLVTTKAFVTTTRVVKLLFVKGANVGVGPISIDLPGPADPTTSGDETYLTTSNNMVGWRAFYDASNSYSVDVNTTVYVADVDPDLVENKITLKAISGIPANVPVILHTSSSADSYKMTLTKETVSPYSYDGTNKLVWTTSAVSEKYRLGYGASGVGFYPYSGTPASGAVILNVSSASGARELTIDIDDDVTGISTMHNSQCIMNNDFYNLAGQRVAQPTKGLYIVNGRKVIIK